MSGPLTVFGLGDLVRVTAQNGLSFCHFTFFPYLCHIDHTIFHSLQQHLHIAPHKITPFLSLVSVAEWQKNVYHAILPFKSHILLFCLCDRLHYSIQNSFLRPVVILLFSTSPSSFFASRMVLVEIPLFTASRSISSLRTCFPPASI